MQSHFKNKCNPILPRALPSILHHTQFELESNEDYTSKHIPKLLITPSSIFFQLQGGLVCKGPGGGYYERNI